MCHRPMVPPFMMPSMKLENPSGLNLFGLEAQSVLRLEKGHVIIVVDTDNHTTLHEIGFKEDLGPA